MPLRRGARRGRPRRHQRQQQQQQHHQQDDDEIIQGTDLTRGQILRAFTLPGHPTAFSAPESVARFFKDRGLTKKKAQEVLRSIDSYVLHKEYKRPQSFNPYFIYRLRDLIQADLIDIRKLKDHNDGVQYLLLIIDVFSRRVWVFPAKSKSGFEMKRLIEHWLVSLRRRPKVFSTDGGREFFNGPVRALLRQMGIEQQLAVGTCKAAYAERANKTIQKLLYKYLTHKESLRYIDKLQNFVDTYNRRGHRSLEFMSPTEADLIQNELRTRAINMRRCHKVKRKLKNLKIGDMVRIKIQAKVIHDAHRSYAEQFKGEYFRIVRVNTRLPIPMYYLQSLNSGEHIQGGFYENELSVVRGNVFKVERVIDRRNRGRLREVLVRWKYFSPLHDAWIPERDLQTL